MAAKYVTIVVEPSGNARHLVDAEAETIGEMLGPKIATQRASHVESWHDLSDRARAWLQEQGWDYDGHRKIDLNAFWADLLPVGGPVLGPFERYPDAISAEVAWLSEHDLPTPAI